MTIGINLKPDAVAAVHDAEVFDRHPAARERRALDLQQCLAGRDSQAIGFFGAGARHLDYALSSRDHHAVLLPQRLV